jgi:low temperature requirement protein LtrA
MELFYDLVFVVVVAALASRLGRDYSLGFFEQIL